MKIRIKHFSKSTLALILSLCLLFSCMTVGIVATDAAKVESSSSVGYDAHFYLIGSGTPVGGWTKNESYKIGSSYSANKYYINAELTKNGFFALHNGSSQYGPTTDQSGITVGGSYNSPTYNSNAWKFTGDTQVVRIIADESSSEWYPKLSLESIDWYMSGWIEGSAKNVANSSYKFTKNSATNYTFTYTSTGATEYVTINDGKSCVYHPSSNNSGTGTAASTISAASTYNSDPKWMISSTSGYTVTVTWNPSTKKLSWSQQAPETKYTVSVQSANTSMGTVGSSSVQAGATTAVTLPTATPKYGYKFKNWTTTSSSITITNATSATAATVTASAAGTVTANFEIDTGMSLYIAGRFHVQTTDTSGVWTNSFDTGDWSNTGDDNIALTYDSGTIYKLETHASIKELSNQISNYDPFFFIYDKGNGKYWYRTTSGTTLSSSNMSTTLTKYDSQTDSVNANLRFNEQSDDKPVSLYFNVATGELSFDIPTYYTVTCNTATGGSVSSDLSRAREGDTVTLTISPTTGYQLSSITVKDASNNTVSLSGSGNSRTFTMPASDVTVTPVFSVINRTVNIYRRFTKADGTVTTESSAVQTISNANVATARTVNAAGTVSNYTFSTFTIPSTVTVRTGSASTSASFTITATADSTIYIDYTETMYTLTLVNSPADGGTIKKSGTSTAITGISVGNITGVTLVATPNGGYQFDSWSKSSSSVTIGSTSSNSTTFKTSANATVTANYTASDYTISAAATPAAGATVLTTDTSGTSKTGGHVNDLFEIRITLNTGYAIDSITFATGEGYAAPTLQSGYPSPGLSDGYPTSGNTVTYRYKLGAGSAIATVNLKAKTPTLSNVQIKNTSLTYSTYSSGATVNTYYKQPVVAKATTDSFSTLTYKTYSTATATTVYRTVSGKASGAEASVDANSTIIPATENGTVTYAFTVTAVNQPAGISTAATKTFTYTISVSFNDAQKAHFRLKQLYDRCVEESTSNNPYYNIGAPIQTYNEAYSAATPLCTAGYPDYNASASDKTTRETAYTNLLARYNALMTYAKTTTVYVLSKYANSASNPIYLNVESNGTTADWNHFRMYSYQYSSYAGGTTEVNDSTYKMTYAGTFVYSGSDKYLYKLTYAGHVRFTAWRGSSSSDVTMDSGDQLTGKITGVTAFKDYYVNVHNTNIGSTSVTSCTEYVDFKVKNNNAAKVCYELNESVTKTRAQIQSDFNFQAYSSLVTSPGITVTNTEYSIYGPVGKSTAQTYNMLSGSGSFPTKYSGRYIVTYTARFSKAGTTPLIEKTVTTSLWVALDEISIYVDMNDNVGNPILNFKYSDSGTTAFLPYEMDLVTGSESIYKYTIKISKMRNDYGINFGEGAPIKVNYITVERMYVNANGKSESRPTTDIDSGAFQIGIDAKITGEVWFKADSTNLTTFNRISYASSKASFLAATNDTTPTLLSGAVTRLQGTGINTDTDEVYNSQYAALYTLDGDTEPMSNFGYVLGAGVAREITSGSTTYYFDKWVAFNTPADGVPVTPGQSSTTVDIPEEAVDYSDETDINIVKAYDFNDGACDMTYVALYKPVASGESPVRLEITYNFEDYDTSDGNYIYDSTKETVDASYTKTVKVELGSVYDKTGATYANFNAVKAAADAIARANAPYVASNYFKYTYASAVVDNLNTSASNNKIIVNAALTKEARNYNIILKIGANSTTYSGNYQQVQELPSTGISNPVWKIKSGSSWVTLGSGATGSTFSARFVSSGNEKEGSTDCQIIKVEAGSATAANNKSVIGNSFTEVYYEGSTERLRHNFYIIDYCTEGKLLGGGVLFGTTDGTDYRQDAAQTNLGTLAGRTAFIEKILGSGANLDYSTEYKVQTIDNTGFRYKPFKSSEDVFRYSEELLGYHTIFSVNNVNSESYDGQTLRLYSFMIYDNGGTPVISISDGYAEVSRYQPQS